MKTHHILPSVALFLLTFICFSTAEVFADVHMKVRIMNGMTESESWISGDKQKSIAQVPLMGEMTSMIDLKEKVQYQLLPSQKIYDRKPIALEYNPNLKAFMKASENRDFSTDPSGGFSPLEDCMPKFQKISEKRTYAGYDVEGYQATCEGKPESVTLWFAKPKLAFDPLTGIEQELKAFQKKHMELLYANFPTEEKKELLERFSNPAAFLGKGMGVALSFKGMPKGFLLAMEMEGIEGPEGMQGGTFFEVTELSHQKIENSLFEIDSTYTEVEDVSQALAGNMMKQMGLGNFGEMFQGVGANQTVQMPDMEAQSNALAALQNAFTQMKTPAVQTPNIPSTLNTPTVPDFPTNIQVPQIKNDLANNFVAPKVPDPTASVTQALERLAVPATNATVPAGMVRKPGPNGWVYESANAQAAASATGGTTPPGMIRKPGPNGWIYEPDPDYQAS